MAVAALQDIRLALAGALQDGLGTENQQVSAYVLRNPTLPTIWIRLKPEAPVTYHQSIAPSGLQLWMFQVEAYCGDVGDIGAQQKLDEYVSSGPKSIYQALEADTTLGGLVQAVKVVQCNAYVEFVRADGSTVVGANWDVEVYP